MLCVEGKDEQPTKIVHTGFSGCTGLVLISCKKCKCFNKASASLLKQYNG